MSANGPNDDTSQSPTAEPAAGDPAAATEAGSDAQAGVPPIAINAQYIKDLSFEVPGSPGVFAELEVSPPDITVNIEVKVNPVQDNVFEVVIQIGAECRVKDTVAFICELAYAGLFTINVPPEHAQIVLLIECPRLIFPFARNILADVTRDGGFPPLMLAPVDFVAMFQNQAAQQATAEAGAGPATA